MCLQIAVTIILVKLGIQRQSNLQKQCTPFRSSLSDEVSVNMDDKTALTLTKVEVHNWKQNSTISLKKNLLIIQLIELNLQQHVSQRSLPYQLKPLLPMGENKS